MPPLIAEVIAIGDELTSGFRLDTNSQWLSQQLGDLGVKVMYHSTVGDDHDANVDVFSNAVKRADIILCTGGLGPTADDLTRQCIAAMAGVELELHQAQLNHLKNFFKNRGREMPPSNEVQAYFPAGAHVIDNPEGTAPGIEYCDVDNNATIFAFPGVPAEMKQMFTGTVQAKIMAMTGESNLIHHHVIRCFGAGESHIESLLPDLVKRGRDPLVGITASGGTISLRLTTRGKSVDQCLEKMAPTVTTIKSILGDLVLGFNDDRLETVVVDQLKHANLSLGLLDMGLHGDVASMLLKSQGPVLSALAHDGSNEPNDLETLRQLAQHIRAQSNVDWGLVIGPVTETNVLSSAKSLGFTVALSTSSGIEKNETFPFTGHSATRQQIACKRVLNFLRRVILEEVSKPTSK